MNKNKKLLIFVVEDNLIFQQLIAKQLDSLSYAIRFFTHGEDCINELKTSTPDVIVLDNSLAGTMSGLDTLKIIRVLHPDLYIVIFSTEKALDTEENYSSYGSFVYLEKSISAFALLREKVGSSEIFLQKTRK